MIVQTRAKRGQQLGRRMGFGAAVIALTVALSLVPGSRVSAHAKYERSEPADGAVLEKAPLRVDVWFSQEMARKGGLPSLVVVNDVGDQVDLGSVLDDNDRKHVFADLAPALPEGRYTVIWHTLSDEDAEEAQGAFHFYVGTGPGESTPAPATPAAGRTPSPTTATPSPPLTEAGSDGEVPAWALAVGILAGAAAGGAGGYVTGRRRGG